MNLGSLFQFKTIENNTEDRIDNLDTLVCLGIREVHDINYICLRFSLLIWICVRSSEFKQFEDLDTRCIQLLNYYCFDLRNILDTLKSIFEQNP